MSNLGLVQTNQEILVTDANDNVLQVGLDENGSLKVNIVNSDGVVLFDAFQTTSAVVSDSNVSGDFTDIQKAIDSLSTNGGTVFIRNGTYLLNADIIMPSNVSLIGENTGGVVLDFQSQAYQILVAGALVDDNGTVAIVNNDTAVVGTGTAFDSAWIGDSILLKGRWFTIVNVIDANNLIIDSSFDATSISGQANVIAEVVASATLQNFTVQNSTHAGGAVIFRYAQYCTFDNVTVLDSTIGANFINATGQSVINFFIGYCGTGIQVSYSGVWTIYNFEIYGSTGDNLLCDNLYNVSCSNATISSASGNNITLTGCEAWSMYDMENTTSQINGIELTDCTDLAISAMTIRNAIFDGVKLTSGCNRISLSQATMINNGGWGLNIADVSDTYTIYGLCYFVTNIAGDVQDNGAGTTSGIFISV